LPTPTTPMSAGCSTKCRAEAWTAPTRSRWDCERRFARTGKFGVDEDESVAVAVDMYAECGWVDTSWPAVTLCTAPERHELELWTTMNACLANHACAVQENAGIEGLAYQCLSCYLLELRTQVHGCFLNMGIQGDDNGKYGI